MVSGGNYAHLTTRTDEEWEDVRDMAKAASDKDKAQRSA